VAALPTTPHVDDDSVISSFNSQAKLDPLHDTRQAFWRSTLVLQSRAIFRLYHLEVVKALHPRWLLPLWRAEGEKSKQLLCRSRLLCDGPWKQ
jgi:hypothetical protein